MASEEEAEELRSRISLLTERLKEARARLDQVEQEREGEGAAMQGQLQMLMQKLRDAQAQP